MTVLKGNETSPNSGSLFPTSGDITLANAATLLAYVVVSVEKTARRVDRCSRIDNL